MAAATKRRRKKSAPPVEKQHDLGEFRPPASWPIGWWQQALDVRQPSYSWTANAAVEACVSAITQTVAMLPVAHWRETAGGTAERVTTSAAARVLRRPNSYQTKADFFLNLTRRELLHGNGYAVAVRNDRFEVDELHIIGRDSIQPIIEDESREIYYRVGGQAFGIVDDFIAPARDVLHLRQHTTYDPLRGETPLTAAALAIDGGNAIAAHHAAFFRNMARPSGVLQTDATITAAQMIELRARWEEQAAKMNAGGTPILTSGLKWEPISVSGVDAAIIEAYKLSIEDIARVFRIPLAVIGSMAGATFNNTETLLRFWLASGLGFFLEHIELALDRLFGLRPNEWIAFDVEQGLLRADLKTRMEALRNGVIAGILSPNEARAREGLGPVEYGDEPRVQMQVVPLSYNAEPPAAPDPAAVPAIAPPPDDGEDDAEEGEPADDTIDDTPTDEERAAILRARYTRMISAAMRRSDA